MKKMKLIFIVPVLAVLVLAVLFSLNYINVKYTRSEKRSPILKSIHLPNDVVLSSLGAVYVRFGVNFGNTDFLASGFRIEANKTVIYIDPVLVDDMLPADYIFITHAHSDHLSLRDIKKLVKEETVIVCPENAASQLSHFTTRKVKPGDSFELGDIKCEATAAYTLGMPTHPQKHQNVGYVIRINDVSIYHAGDTDFVPQLKDIENVTAALVPIDGGSLTMDTESAATLINIIKPQIAVPMHYGIEKNTLGKFEQLVDKDIKVEILH